MENKKSNQTEKKTAGSCPSAMNGYLFIFVFLYFFFKSERVRISRAAIYNQHHVPDVYVKYYALYFLFFYALFCLYQL